MPCLKGQKCIAHKQNRSCQLQPLGLVCFQALPGERILDLYQGKGGGRERIACRWTVDGTQRIDPDGRLSAIGEVRRLLHRERIQQEIGQIKNNCCPEE